MAAKAPRPEGPSVRAVTMPQHMLEAWTAALARPVCSMAETPDFASIRRRKCLLKSSPTSVVEAYVPVLRALK